MTGHLFLKNNRQSDNFYHEMYQLSFDFLMVVEEILF